MIEIYQEIIGLIAHGERAVLATVLSRQGSAPRKSGAKMLIKRDGSITGSIGGGDVEQEIKRQAIETMDSGVPQIVHLDLSGRGEEEAMICGGQMDIFLEPIAPQETLYLFGAGHVSQSTAVIAKMLEFRVVVIDPRPEYTNAERFPDADMLVTEDYESAFPKLKVDENSYIIIYTPGHVLDERCLGFAIGTTAKYVGMIGSKKKVKEIKDRLIQKGVTCQQLDRAHAPIGMEISAETPAEIAISIMAEIVQVRRNSPGGGGEKREKS
ncbi:XdhC family protein [Chloroflexota bacterium]